MYTGSNQSRRKFKARTHGSRLYREMRWKLQRRNQAFLRLLRVKLPLPSLFSCLLPFTKANIKVRIPVHDAYLLSMQMRNVSAEVDAKRYGNVNRVTVPAAVPSRHTGVRISSESRQPSRRKARVNSPREDPQTYSLFSSPLTVTCHPPMRSSSEIYVVNMTIGTVIAATHAIL